MELINLINEILEKWIDDWNIRDINSSFAIMHDIYHLVSSYKGTDNSPTTKDIQQYVKGLYDSAMLDYDTASIDRSYDVCESINAYVNSRVQK